MCGIVGGIFHTTHMDPSHRGLLNAMRDTLTHRGPDDAGSWWSPDGRVGLGHRRLSILDLTPGGHQPMLSPDGQTALVFNGEIYNFSGIRGELESAGVRFRSTCDTEVLLEAYRRWGVDCLDRLDGMFAFALYDAAAGTLLLARDRAGEKPLYYRHDGGSFRFASELKALLAEPACPREIDRDALNEYLAYGYVSGEACMLAGVRKLAPGWAMRIDVATGERRAWPYWSLPTDPPDGAAADGALLDRLDDLLRESVRRRLVADVPVGILLSGGVDSSLVTAMAAAVSSGPVKTFTVTFPGHGEYDEGPYARRVAEHFSTDHTELVAEPATIDLLPTLARQYDEPMADSSMIPTYLVSRLIRQHATVALGGDAGDELFGGYPGHRWVQQMARTRRWLPGFVRRAMHAAVIRHMPLGRKGRNYLLALTTEADRSCVQINQYFDPLWRGRLLGDGLGGGIGDWLAPERRRLGLQPDGASLLRRITAMDFGAYLPDDILVKVDRASMLTSLEVRAPFLARDVIEFAFGQVPDRLRATAGDTKILTKRLARKLLPADLDLDRKQGFTLPLQSWFAGPWGDEVRSILLDSRDGPFDRRAVETLLDQQAAGYRHTQRLFALTMFELWRSEYSITLPR